MRKNVFAFCLAIGLAALLIPCLAGARSSGMVSVTNWDSNCCASCTNLPEWNNMISRWYLNVRDSKHGAQAFDDFIKSQVDGYIPKDYLTDYPAPGHDDDEWIDLVGIAIVGMHGSDYSTHWLGLPRSQNGYGSSSCGVEAGELDVGNLYSVNLVLSSCESVDKKYFDQWVTWKHLFGGIHQLNGFHGCMWIRESLRDNYMQFADDGFDVPLKTAFMDNLWVQDIGYGGIVLDEQCPVSVSAGADVTQAIFHRDNFYYYSWGAKPTGHDSWARQGVVGCDPDCEGVY